MNVGILGPSLDDKSLQEIQASHACHAVSVPGIPALLMPCHRGELIGHPATFQVGLLLQTMLTLCPLLNSTPGVPAWSLRQTSPQRSCRPTRPRLGCRTPCPSWIWWPSPTSLQAPWRTGVRRCAGAIAAEKGQEGVVHWWVAGPLLLCSNQGEHEHPWSQCLLWPHVPHHRSVAPPNPRAGLILYRETALLTSPTSSLADRRWVAKVVAHEMAHMVRG